MVGGRLMTGRLCDNGKDFTSGEDISGSRSDNGGKTMLKHACKKFNDMRKRTNDQWQPEGSGASSELCNVFHLSDWLGTRCSVDGM
jgi:hypothetical protein